MSGRTIALITMAMETRRMVGVGAKVSSRWSAGKRKDGKNKDSFHHLIRIGWGAYIDIIAIISKTKPTKELGTQVKEEENRMGVV